MSFTSGFLAEFDNEMKTTRSLLERVPLDNGAWKPHAKSTSLGALASHLAGVAGYGGMVASTDELDTVARAAQPRTPDFTSTGALLSAYDANVAATRAAIAALSDDQANAPWTLRAGDHVVFTMPKKAALRTMLMSHMIHHRGQLSVYLRLNEVPLPSIYGPSADTPMGPPPR